MTMTPWLALVLSWVTWLFSSVVLTLSWISTLDPMRYLVYLVMLLVEIAPTTIKGVFTKSKDSLINFAKLGAFYGQWSVFVGIVLYLVGRIVLKISEKIRRQQIIPPLLPLKAADVHKRDVLDNDIQCNNSYFFIIGSARICLGFSYLLEFSISMGRVMMQLLLGLIVGWSLFYSMLGSFSLFSSLCEIWAEVRMGMEAVKYGFIYVGKGIWYAFITCGLMRLAKIGLCLFVLSTYIWYMLFRVWIRKYYSRWKEDNYGSFFT